MARPFALIGFSLAFSLIVCSVFGVTFGLVTSVVCFVIFLFSLFIKNKYILISVLLATLTIGSLIYCLTYENKILPVESLSGKTSNIVATVLEKADNCYKIKVNEIDGKDASFKLILYSKDEINVDYYDKIQLDVKFFQNENNYDFGDGYYISGTLKNNAQIIANHSNEPMYYAKIIRDKAKQIVKSSLTKSEGDVLVAMLLGDKTLLSSDLKSSFSSVGVYHLFAVSGLHLSILSGAVYYILKKFKLSNKICSLLSILFVIFYICLSGFSFSVVRAGIIVIVSLIGIIFQKQSDSLNSLGIAVTLILLITPMAIFDVSFLLTVSAFLGVITLSAYLTEKCNKTYSKFKYYKLFKAPLTAFVVSISVFIFTLPVIFVFFGETSFISPLTNIIFIPLASITLVCGGLAIIFSFSNLIMYPLFFISGLTAKLMIFLSTNIENLFNSNLSLNKTYLFLWLSATIILVGISLVISKSTKYLKLVALLSSIILVISSFSYNYISKPNLKLTVLDVKNGLCVTAHYNNKTVLVGCSGSNAYTNSISEIKSVDDKIDLAISMNLDDDLTNFNKIDSKTPIQNVLVSQENIQAYQITKNIIVNNNITVDLCDGFSVKYTCYNSSTVVQIIFGTEKIVICNSKSNNFISDTGDVFITKRPVPIKSLSKINVISSNKYGIKTSQQLNDMGYYTLVTAGQGSLNFSFDGKGKYKVKRVN